MNRGFLESLQVQKMMNLTPNWWNINSTSTMKPPPPQQQQQQSSSSPHQLLPSSPSHLFPHHEFAHQPSLPLNSWHDSSTNQELPVESWSQLLLGGSVVGEDEDRSGLNNNYQQVAKKLENWEEQILYPPPSIHVVHDVKQEFSENAYLFALRNQGGFSTTQEGIIRPSTNWSHQLIMPVSSPSSCVTAATFSSTNNTTNDNNNNMLDFSSRKSDGNRHPQPDHSSECNSTATGGTFKKARIQPSSTLSTFKVRKEKLGDRITALHQLVSPFGKTDTASVLLEAIGYIRFLQSQIEALSSPYMGNASGNMRQQHSVQAGEKSSIFPDDPGQLLNNDTSCMKRRGLSDKDPENEPKKDLKSRGLCLVPVSCTLQVGSDNGADYWAPAALGGGFR